MVKTKKRTKSAQARKPKANHADNSKVITKGTITLVDLYMNIMRPPHAIVPQIERPRQSSRA